MTLHVEALGPRGDFARDVAERDQAEHVAGQLGHRRHVPPRVAPAVLADRLVQRDRLLGQAQQQHHRVVGDFVDEDVGTLVTTMPRSVAASRSTRSTPTPPLAMTLQSLELTDDLGAQRASADHDRVGVADLGDVRRRRCRPVAVSMVMPSGRRASCSYGKSDSVRPPNGVAMTLNATLGQSPLRMGWAGQCTAGGDARCGHRRGGLYLQVTGV